MSTGSDNTRVVFVKFESADGVLHIARHERTALPSPDEQVDEYIREIVHDYKSNPGVTYLGLADQDEYDAFMKIKG
jgi:hypothetical protein